MIDKLLDYKERWARSMLNLSHNQQNIDHGFCIVDPPAILKRYIETHNGCLPPIHKLGPYVKFLKVNANSTNDFFYFKNYKQQYDDENSPPIDDIYHVYEYCQGLLVYSELPSFKIPDYFWRFYFENPDYKFIEPNGSDHYRHITGCCPDGRMANHVINVQYYMIIFVSKSYEISMNVCPSDTENYGKLALFELLDEDSYCHHIMEVDNNCRFRRLNASDSYKPWEITARIPTDDIDVLRFLAKLTKNDMFIKQIEEQNAK